MFEVRLSHRELIVNTTMSRAGNMINGSASLSTYLEHILNKVQHHELVCDKGNKSKDKPIEFVQPEELGDKIGNLTIGKEPISDDKLDAIVENVIRYSVKTSSPRFHNQVCLNHDTGNILSHFSSSSALPWC